jgi:hypothetical protein
MVMRGNITLRIKTLTVRSGIYEIWQALRLKEVANGLGLDITVTWTPNPGMPDADGWSPNGDGSSEGWSGYEDGGGSDDE